MLAQENERIGEIWILAGAGNLAVKYREYLKKLLVDGEVSNDICILFGTVGTIKTNHHIFLQIASYFTFNL